MSWRRSARSASSDGPARTRSRRSWPRSRAPAEVQRRFPRYAEMTDPIERRGAIVRLHAEGWNIASIAGYLETSRPTVYATLKRWIDGGRLRPGGQGADRATSRRPRPTLWAMKAVRKLQQNPELGAFRIHAALKQLGIHLSTRTCGRILARNRKLYGLRGPEAKPREPKPMPFKADRRHQYWTVDVRYIDVHQLGGGNIYTITIIDNYSRFIVGSVLSRTQDQPAFLQVLLSAVTEYGAPEALVSDGGSIFKAKRAMAIYAALGIRKEQITLRQPWQSYIETCFNVQRRMADYHFAKATTWDELLQTARGLGPRLQQPGALGASEAPGWSTQPGRGPRLGQRTALQRRGSRTELRADPQHPSRGSEGVRPLPELAPLRRTRAGRAVSLDLGHRGGGDDPVRRGAVGQVRRDATSGIIGTSARSPPSGSSKRPTSRRSRHSWSSGPTTGGWRSSCRRSPSATPTSSSLVQAELFAPDEVAISR